MYQTFVNMMNTHIRTMMDVGNPFKLSHVKNMLRSDFDAVGACVVMASPGFLQNGVSRHLFERWCDDARNGVIIAGYTVEGTLAHQLLEQPQTITCQDNVIKPRRCQIEHVSFTAHVDYNDNLRFIKAVAPDYIVLVHGEKNGMKRLKEELDKEIRRNWPSSNRPPVTMPDNNTRIQIRFPKSVTAECVGQLGQELLDGLVELENQESKAQSTAVSAPRDLPLPRQSIMVTENFVSKVVAASELSTFTSCRRGRVVQKLVVPVPEGLLGNPGAVARGGLLRALVPYLDELFDAVVLDLDGTCTTAPAMPASVSATSSPASVSLVIQGIARVCEDYSGSGSVPSALLVAWEASPSSDLIADCAVGAILQTLSVSSLLHLSLLGQSLGGLAAAADEKGGAKAARGKGKKGKDADSDGGGDPLGADDVTLFRGSKRRNTKGHVHVKAEPEGSSSSSSSSNSNSSSASDNVLEKRLESIVEQMRAGKLDPSRALPADCLAFSSSASHAHDNRTKLENLRAQLVAMPQVLQSFSAIKLTADGLKLIFVSATRGAPGGAARAKKVKVEGLDQPLEAFVYIAFTEQGRHEAAVACDDEGLRADVAAALALLS